MKAGRAFTQERATLSCRIVDPPVGDGIITVAVGA